jgi:hypothetical protein
MSGIESVQIYYDKSVANREENNMYLHFRQCGANAVDPDLDVGPHGQSPTELDGNSDRGVLFSVVHDFFALCCLCLVLLL